MANEQNTQNKDAAKTSSDMSNTSDKNASTQDSFANTGQKNTASESFSIPDIRIIHIASLRTRN